MTQLAARGQRVWHLSRSFLRAFPVPFGRHTRYLIASYFLHTFLVACAVLTIALSIDLTLFLSKVLATISLWDTSWTAFYLAWYVVLRGTDFLAELLPLICFFGVFWTEIAHTFTRERLIVWLSGRTPLQCLLPALLFGLAIGSTQLVLNRYLRPSAVMVMAENRLGSYGERFDPRPVPRLQWLALGRNVVQAFVEPGDQPYLRDVTIYRMDEALSLQTVFRAKTAKPVGRNEWLLSDGYRWSPPNETNQSTKTGGDAEPNGRTAFAEERIQLAISPVWLNNRRVTARYLTNDVFSALARENFHPANEFRTWEQARWSLALFCVAMTTLASTMSVLLIANTIGLWQLATIAVAGYAANALMKLSVLFGEHGYVGPVVAGWLVPILIMSGCVIAILLRAKQSQRSGGEQIT